MARYLYSELAGLVGARLRCMANAANQNSNESTRDHFADTATIHEAAIQRLVREHMPRGSGFDEGTRLDYRTSHQNKLVFTTAFHHMNDGGFYDGWTEHTVTVTPAFVGDFDIRVSGRNRNDIKDYIAERFREALDTELPEPTR